jgi:hypothetical protein
VIRLLIPVEVVSMASPHFPRSTLIVAALSLAAACGDDSTAPTSLPLPEPASFVPTVTNQYFPLIPGTTWLYESSDGSESNTVEVLSETKDILGITATVVHDQVFTDGELTEDTFDWYAQDSDGNVWYLGEDSREMENGQVVSTEGSWEAGVNGAQAGIIMWADPGAHIGEEYRQEFAEGEAEDAGKVIAVGESVTVPFGSFTGCLKTADRNLLESGSTENKYYCPEVGTVLEHPVQSPAERTELIDVTGP